MLKHDCQPHKSSTRFTSPLVRRYFQTTQTRGTRLDKRNFRGSRFPKFENSRFPRARPRACYRGFREEFRISSSSVATKYPEDENERTGTGWFFTRVKFLSRARTRFDIFSSAIFFFLFFFTDRCYVYRSRVFFFFFFTLNALRGFGLLCERFAIYVWKSNNCKLARLVSGVLWSDLLYFVPLYLFNFYCQFPIPRFY